MTGFGQKFFPIIAHSSYQGNEWSMIKFSDHDSVKISLMSRSLHYGESVFEGMKAYFPEKSDQPFLFRPNMHYRRFIESSKRIGLPLIPNDIFDNALKTLVHYARDVIQESAGRSLYLRPILFSVDQNIGLEKSNESLFAVLASPCDLYYTRNISVLIERELSRAVPGGTGNIKCSSNYASSFMPSEYAKMLGYDQILWLDSNYKKYIEELTAMNIFIVINNELITPKLSGTILPGVTRDSIITLARGENIPVREENINVDDLIEKLKDGSCSELFACGTGAGIVGINLLGEKNGSSYELPEFKGSFRDKLKRVLDDVQADLRQAPNDWRVKCPAKKEILDV